MTSEAQKLQVLEQEVQRLQTEVETLKKSEAYYRCLFENAPIALLAEDLSDVKISLDNLRNNGVQDFRVYFDEYPEAVKQHYQLIKEDTIFNKEFLALYKAHSIEHLLSKLETVFFSHYSTFKELFIALTEKKVCFSTKTIDNALDHSPIHAMATWQIAAGYEDTWARIIVSVVPFYKNISD
jgi:hypothetical protein